MRISDWRSYVCSSDLQEPATTTDVEPLPGGRGGAREVDVLLEALLEDLLRLDLSCGVEDLARPGVVPLLHLGHPGLALRDVLDRMQVARRARAETDPVLGEEWSPCLVTAAVALHLASVRSEEHTSDIQSLIR